MNISKIKLRILIVLSLLCSTLFLGIPRSEANVMVAVKEGVKNSKTIVQSSQKLIAQIERTKPIQSSRSYLINRFVDPNLRMVTKNKNIGIWEVMRFQKHLKNVEGYKDKTKTINKTMNNLSKSNSKKNSEHKISSMQGSINGYLAELQLANNLLNKGFKVKSIAKNVGKSDIDVVVEKFGRKFLIELKTGKNFKLDAKRKMRMLESEVRQSPNSQAIFVIQTKSKISNRDLADLAHWARQHNVKMVYGDNSKQVANEIAKIANANKPSGSVAKVTEDVRIIASKQWKKLREFQPNFGVLWQWAQ